MTNYCVCRRPIVDADEFFLEGKNLPIAWTNKFNIYLFELHINIRQLSDEYVR